jgi:hypothetical protein
MLVDFAESAAERRRVEKRGNLPGNFDAELCRVELAAEMSIGEKLLL